MKIVIAIDSFKGSMSSVEAGNAAKEGIERTCNADIVVKPLADGGEGTTEALVEGMGGEYVSIEVTGPLGAKRSARYGILGDRRTAVLEMAEASGIILVKREELDPSRATTYGVGEMILDAVRRGCRKFIIGIGGSATSDGGAGMLQALGMRAYRADGSEITLPLSPRLLPEVARTDCRGLPAGGRITVLADVRASLVPDGTQPLSALDFAAQKGFTAADMPSLEAALRRWREVAPARSSAVDGAAGGIGYALAAVAGCRHCSGAAFVADSYGLSFAPADTVITGEGRIDAQTGGGKVVAEMHARALAAGCRFTAIGGSVDGTHPFRAVAVDAPGTPPPQTQAEAAARLRRASATLTI